MAETRIRVTLHGHLWRLRPERVRVLEIALEGEATVEEVLSALCLPGDQIMLVLVNGTRAAPGQGVCSGDHLELLPVINGG